MPVLLRSSPLLSKAAGNSDIKKVMGSPGAEDEEAHHQPSAVLPALSHQPSPCRWPQASLGLHPPPGIISVGRPVLGLHGCSPPGQQRWRPTGST